jgi:amino acid transporter
VKLLDLLFGRRLANNEHDTRRIGWFEAVPAMGLDGLSSSSYGPEAALAMLIPLGSASLGWIEPIMALIVALLLVLYISYRQTIVAYPVNGGAYTVAKDNLGRHASLMAAAALMIDYILNVAVGISAGVGALISSVPSLHADTLPLCLGVLALVTVANLRGTGEAGWLFSAPTYLFVASFLGFIAIGLWRAIGSGGHPHAITAPPPMAHATEAVGVWILVRAFAAGCTAMTGVEAVSNGVGTFKAPVVKKAHITLTIICVLLALLLGGVAVVARIYGLSVMDQTKPNYQSLLSQLAAAVVGRGPVYYVAMSALLAVLCLSANTSYVGFPRVCKLVAEDGFLPRSFALADRRLVFSVGVGFLAVTAGTLLVVFDGVTDRLIPLFAIGAFLTFTLSQAGMVVHWRKQAGRHHHRLAINAVGACATGVALVVILLAKFMEGAWLVALAIPATVALFLGIRRYYDRLDARLAPSGPLTVAETEPPVVLVAVEGRSRMTDHALQFAMSLSPDVIAVHLLRLEGPDQEEDGREVRRLWVEEVEKPLKASGATPPRLVLLPAPFRCIQEPLLDFIDKLEPEEPERSIAVLIPELVTRRWWQRLLHVGRAERLRKALLRHGDPDLRIITAPWRG